MNDDLQSRARTNIVDTYTKLAQVMPGVTVRDFGHHLRAESKLDMVMGNFAIRFDASSENLTECLDDLELAARRHRTFRIFLLDGDRPSSLRFLLEGRGFLHQDQMHQLACLTDGENPPEMLEATAPDERTAISQFMVRCFFLRRDPGLRRVVTRATADSGHRLFYLGSLQDPLGAVMLTESPGSVGLYNLCVSPPHRERGLGGQILRFARHFAFRSGSPILLQCHPSLTIWYAKQGFFGFGDVFSLRFVQKTL